MIDLRRLVKFIGGEVLSKIKSKRNYTPGKKAA